MGILYRLYLMYLMYVHNYSVQSVDNSERMIVMLCAYLNSFPYWIFIFLLFICLIRVQRYKNSAKSFCVAAKNGINMRILTKMSCSYSDNRLIFPDNASPHAMKEATGHWLTASTFIFPPFHLIIISWYSSLKCIHVDVNTYIHG